MHLRAACLAAAVLLSPASGGSRIVIAAPAQPAAAPASVRFFAMGDQGTGDPDQGNVARAVFELCQRSGCDFGLLLGDNFYPSGVESTSDPQWQAKFEKPYADLLAAGIPFYAVLGNHDTDEGRDWGRADHQVAYSGVSGL